MKIARYAASEQIACFDFFLWLVLVKAKGAEGIAIDLNRPKTGKFTAQEVFERFQSIIVPGPELAGLPSWLGANIPDIRGSTEEFFQWRQSFDRLISVKKPIDVQYTITLRHLNRVSNRNSNEAAWRQFGKEIGATIIEDYCDKPIHLHDRMALYAGAKMNFLVNSGPAAMLSVTSYPYINFVIPGNWRPFKKIGVMHGAQFPWMLPNQRMLWSDDTLENLREAFLKYTDGG